MFHWRLRENGYLWLYRQSLAELCSVWPRVYALLPWDPGREKVAGRRCRGEEKGKSCGVSPPCPSPSEFGSDIKETILICQRMFKLKPNKVHLHSSQAFAPLVSSTPGWQCGWSSANLINLLHKPWRSGFCSAKKSVPFPSPLSQCSLQVLRRQTGGAGITIPSHGHRLQ